MFYKGLFQKLVIRSRVRPKIYTHIYIYIYIYIYFVGFASAADLKDGSWVLRVFDEQASAVLTEERVFWTALVDCLGTWINDDGFRKQFRTCEFGKFGGIVCRNKGTKRKSRSEAVEETETRVVESSDDEADADEDDMVLFCTCKIQTTTTFEPFLC